LATIVRKIRSRRMRWLGLVERILEGGGGKKGKCIWKVGGKARWKEIT
jgi:hypothetical protein